MAVAISDLLKPLDKTEVLSDLYALANLYGLTTTAWQPGEPAPAILGMTVGFLVDKVWNPIVLPALRGQFLDYPDANWTPIKTWADYNRPIISALAATGPIDIENRGSGFGTIAAGQVRIKHATTNKTYTNTTSGTVVPWSGSGPYPTVTPTMTFEADEVGTASNALAGTIATGLVASPFVGLYAITNASPLLGQDQEDLSQLVKRARASLAELAPSSPLLAYVSAALDPIGTFTRRKKPYPSTWGTAAPAISRVRVLDKHNVPAWAALTVYAAHDVVQNSGRLYECITGGTSAASGGPSTTAINITDGSAHWNYVGEVAVYLASPSGPSGGDSTTADTDVFKANSAIQLFIVPPGLTATVSAAYSRTIALGTVTLYVKADSNVTAAEAVANADAALADFFSTLAIGGTRITAGATGYVYANKVRGILEAPSYIANVALTLNDTALRPPEVAVPTYTLQANVVDQGG